MRIEKAADIKKAIDEFLSNLNIDENINVICSDAWFPFPKYISEKDTLLQLDATTGVYIFSEPDKDNPFVPLHLNPNRIWYIGMSENDSIRKRVWQHLDPMNFEKLDSNELGTQQWGAKDWYNRDSVDLKIRQAIIVGKFVVYGIGIDAFSEMPGLTRKLEKYLLDTYQNTNGNLPVFNIKN